MFYAADINKVIGVRRGPIQCQRSAAKAPGRQGTGPPSPSSRPRPPRPRPPPPQPSVRTTSPAREQHSTKLPYPCTYLAGQLITVPFGCPGPVNRSWGEGTVNLSSCGRTARAYRWLVILVLVLTPLPLWNIDCIVIVSEFPCSNILLCSGVSLFSENLR